MFNLGRLLCRMGFHRWGDKFVDAGKDWAFGMGHHACKCSREGCGWIKRYWPS